MFLLQVRVKVGDEYFSLCYNNYIILNFFIDHGDTQSDGFMS